MAFGILGRLARAAGGGIVVGALTVALHAAFQEEYISGIQWPQPPVVDPGPENGVPSDAIVLFDGRDLLQWEGGENWIIQDGYAIADKSGISTKQSFGDCQLHLEFASPAQVEGEGQGRGNSGVYMMSRYEIQILDSFENTTYYDGQAGAIYKQQPPIVNASRRPGEWQSFDILFETPRFDAEGKVVKPAYVTVLHNGIVIHHHFELQGDTAYDKPPAYTAHPDKLPIHIQFHGNPVRFRNIWLRENIQPLGGQKPQA